MISLVEGTVAAVRENSLVVMVGGLGLEVLATRAVLAMAREGETLRLDSYLLVREDALTLFGFESVQSLEMFRLVIGVSGVGPKLGLALLSNLGPELLAGAILKSDVALLASTPGIGKRTAERLALELQNKLPETLKQAGERSTGAGATAPAFRDAVEALVALGYRESSARSTISALLEADPGASAEALIRKGLAKLR
ncbi:MAG TPA: Holliday junction branch migration protein RuvA [Deinococcales bacterium]|nr:Holliday junction branch migration protein RuvA [Deinococcales bacterium]